jgi:hypothetical protein
VHADAQPALGEAERRGAASDAGTDDRDVDAAVVPGVRALRSEDFFEPVRVQDVER